MTKVCPGVLIGSFNLCSYVRSLNDESFPEGPELSIFLLGGPEFEQIKICRQPLPALIKIRKGKRDIHLGIGAEVCQCGDTSLGTKTSES